MKPIGLDEYPIHQTSLPMSRAGTTDVNFYDRCYFNAHDRTGDIFLVTGLGTYPHMGVTDAYAVLRQGDELRSVCFSDELPGRRLEQRAGRYRIEIVEPLSKIRLVCEPTPESFGFDLQWEGSYPAVFEQPHTFLTGDRTGHRAVMDSSRFAQVGSWSGTIVVDDREIEVDPEVWVGFRDRSWGIRPIGAPTRASGIPEDWASGFWWTYVPIRFEDHFFMIIAQETPDGYRTLNDAIRVYEDGRVEQLGWPRIEIDYQSGTRRATGARIYLATPQGDSLRVDVEAMSFMPLGIGSGYLGDTEWSHGQWMGDGWSRSAVYDLTTPEMVDRLKTSIADHVARATCNGQVGWGMFEHTSLGRHDPSGFKDFADVAP